jgi:hypothetical protein
MTKRVLLVGLMVAMSSSLLAAGPVAASASSTGTWKVVGDVQGVPVILSCSLVEADLKLTGACVDDQKKSHLLAGDVKDQTVTWAFNTEYEGTPITVTLVGVLDPAGAKMAGTIGVDPMGVDGSFVATLVPAAAPATAPATVTPPPSR